MMSTFFLPRPAELLSQSPSSRIRRQPKISCLYNPQNYHPVNVNHDERVTIAKLKQKKQDKIPITVVTAYDYPSAVHVAQAGIDICLVSDSASMVVHGYDTNLEITLEEMLIHCRAVARGARCRPLLVGDLPFGTYEMSTHQAVETAVRVLKEGGMDAVKLDGGSPPRIDAAKAIVGAGIAVMGCVRLNTQGCVDSAIEIMETAISLQKAGCFSVVLECMPAPLAAVITDKLQIPTIGFGAGRYCSGQVLLYHDLLGVFHRTGNAKVVPEFCKQYGNVGDAINNALLKYKDDVTGKSFPCSAFTPYSINIDKLSEKLKIKKYYTEAQVAQQKEAELEKEKAIKRKEMEERKSNTPNFNHNSKL